MKSQKKVWNKIAPEWKKFRDEPNEKTIKFLKEQKGKILDLACGTGRNFVETKGKMYGVDFSRKMLKLAKAKAKKLGIKLKKSRAEKIPFKDNFFDAAIFLAALHCIETKEKREKAVQELHRVLKPKAIAKIAVWNKNSKRFKNSEKEKLIGWKEKGERYYYLFNEKEIYKLFEKNGFKIIKKENPKQEIVFIVKNCK